MKNALNILRYKNTMVCYRIQIRHFISQLVGDGYWLMKQYHIFLRFDKYHKNPIIFPKMKKVLV